MTAILEQGEVDITIAGEVYTLKLSMKAACQIQQRMKKTVGELMLAAERLDYEAISSLMWAVLQHHHGDRFKTIDTVYGLLDKGGGPKPFFEFARKLQEAEAMDGEAKAAADANPPSAQADGTGDSSRSLHAVSA